jgi:predicted peptidase
MATQACDTRRAITDSARDIIDNNNAGVRSILDFLTQDKIATLQAENQALRLTASQQAQNAFLIDQLGTKVPVPAYVVANPYANYGGCGATTYYSGCGCG